MVIGTQECRTPGRGLAWPAGPATDQERCAEPPPRDSLGPLLLWVVKGAQTLSSELTFRKGFREVSQANNEC